MQTTTMQKQGAKRRLNFDDDEEDNKPLYDIVFGLQNKRAKVVVDTNEVPTAPPSPIMNIPIKQEFCVPPSPIMNTPIKEEFCAPAPPPAVAKKVQKSFFDLSSRDEESKSEWSNYVDSMIRYWLINDCCKLPKTTFVEYLKNKTLF